MNNNNTASAARRTVLAAALAAAFTVAAPGAHAQSNAELLKELRALRERVAELEKRVAATPAPAPAPVAAASAAAPAPETQPGMTAEQAQDFARIATKTEALEDTRDANGFKNLKISGYLDPSFIANRARNTASLQFLNGVGDDGYTYDNSYFGAVALDVQKETDSGTRYRLTLIPNRGSESVGRSDNRLVHEASAMVPLGSLRTYLLAGHIPDWSGYEYLQPTLNKLITHNLLFDFTLPTSYTGAGVQHTMGKWMVKALLADMNASKKPSGNKTPAFAYRVDYAKGEFHSMGFAGVHGKAVNFKTRVVGQQWALDPEDGVIKQMDVEAQEPESRVDLFEIDGSFIRGDWTLQGQASIGRQRRAAITPDPLTGALRDARWWGLSGLVAYKVTPRFETVARLDYINNRKNGGGLLGYTANDSHNGIGYAPGGDPERGANRAALSLGLLYAFDTNTTLKAEYRLDRASQPVFEYVETGEYKKTNHLLGASVVVSF
ncbi:DUF3138 family protein [Azohydromonas caseinilytica]|uniref:DUF3138 family protein n=1 Tax=Azohydromonas caseinilytica TaxID=2728836 RepID=A0A848FCD7_9BURK|nr:DUF3138 family protein [Azohydromonas caseinilytica]NML16616.1 DUF3138 family protein [Azohydromonas caseinilytica]